MEETLENAAQDYLADLKQDTMIHHAMAKHGVISSVSADRKSMKPCESAMRTFAEKSETASNVRVQRDLVD